MSEHQMVDKEFPAVNRHGKDCTLCINFLLGDLDHTGFKTFLVRPDLLIGEFLTDEDVEFEYIRQFAPEYAYLIEWDCFHEEDHPEKIPAFHEAMRKLGFVV